MRSFESMSEFTNQSFRIKMMLQLLKFQTGYELYNLTGRSPLQVELTSDVIKIEFMACKIYLCQMSKYPVSLISIFCQVSMCITDKNFKFTIFMVLEILVRHILRTTQLSLPYMNSTERKRLLPTDQSHCLFLLYLTAGAKQSNNLVYHSVFSYYILSEVYFFKKKSCAD